MAKTSKQKPKKQGQKLPAVETLEDAAAAQLKISELLISMHAYEDAIALELQVLRKREEALIDPLREEILLLGKSIFAYAQKNKGELTQEGKKKTVSMPMKTGMLQWYFTPPSVQIDAAGEVLERIKTLGLLQFIRTKEEINKEALLEDPKLARTIQGVTIQSQEKFAIKPAEAKERIECSIATKRWRITTAKK